MFSKSSVITCITVLVSLFTISCNDKISECEVNKVIVGQYYEGLNMQLKETAELILHDHFVKYINGTKSEKYGPVIYLEEIGDNTENNIDYIYKIDEMIADNNKVVVLWNWESTNIQFENPVQVTVKGISVFEFEDSKIKKLHEIFDKYDYFHQLGYKCISPESRLDNFTE